MLRFLFGTGVLCVLALSWLPLQQRAEAAQREESIMSITHGMNVEEVKGLERELRTHAQAIEDIKGKRVSTGSPGSATEVFAFRV